MAYHWPDGHDARLRDFERRISVCDTDIKRLWKAMPAGDRLLNPAFDGESPADQGGGNVLLSMSSGFARAQLASLYESQLSGSDFSVTQINNTSEDPGELDQYALIVLQSPGSHASMPSWTSSPLTSWLSGLKNRRFVFGPVLDTPSSYWDDIGVPDAEILGSDAIPDSTNVFADPTSHYLATGHSLRLTLSNYKQCAGGTLMYEINAVSDGTSGPIVMAEQTSIGSEVIYGLGLIVSLCLNSTQVTANTTFLQRLYPSDEYGGIPIP